MGPACSVFRFGVPLVMQVVSGLQLAELKLKILELTMRPEAELETLNLVSQEEFQKAELLSAQPSFTMLVSLMFVCV